MSVTLALHDGRAGNARQALALAKALDADAALLADAHSVAWLLNLRGADVEYNPVFLAHLLVSPDGAELFVGEGKVDAALARFEQAARIYAANADPFRGPALDLHRAQCLVAQGRGSEVGAGLPTTIAALERGLGAQAWDTREAIRLAASLATAPAAR